MAMPADGGSALDLLLQPLAKKVNVGAVTRAADALKYFVKPGGASGKKSACNFCKTCIPHPPRLVP
eukprot:365542-Chlamydomonas_euryale.AAC.2